MINEPSVFEPLKFYCMCTYLVLIYHFGSLSLSRTSVVRLANCPNMVIMFTLEVKQQLNNNDDKMLVPRHQHNILLRTHGLKYESLIFQMKKSSKLLRPLQLLTFVM